MLLTLDFEWYEMVLLVLAGFMAGIVNTIAGSGTLFTFGALLFTGIPITLANTTNRIGVFFQNVAGISSYLKYGNYSLKEIKPVHIIPTLLGAMSGAVMAVGASERLLNLVAAGVMVLLGLELVFNLKARFLSAGPSQGHPVWISVILLFAVGFYGGFIQIGIGLLLIAVLHQLVADSYKKSNFLKLVLILIYTMPTTLYFTLKGQIIWLPAILLSIGQIGGAYLAGFYSNISTRTEQVIKRVMMIMILATLGKIMFW